MMNVKLQTKLSLMVFGLLFLGYQSINAQAYQGVPYVDAFLHPNPISIGSAVGVGDKVQLEFFDAMSADASGPGANTGASNPANGAGTYFDKSVDGSEQPTEENGKSQLRSGTDVDLTDVTDPETGAEITVVTGNQGQEYQFFTLNVLTSGMYTIKARYSNSDPTEDKKLQVFYYPDPSNLSNRGVPALMNSSGSGTNPPNMVPTYSAGETPVYGYSEETTPFELTEGSLLISVTHLSANWQVDYISFTLKETLSTEEVSLRNSLKVYPNPSKTGQFQLSLDSDWKVYSLLGAKVLEGNGKTVDLNSAGVSRGTYILRTPHVTKKVIFN